MTSSNDAGQEKRVCEPNIAREWVTSAPPNPSAACPVIRPLL